MKNRSGINRRTFLSLSTAIAAGTVAGTAGLTMFPSSRQAKAGILAPGMKATASFCEVCFWKCGIQAWTNSEGRLVQITGHPAHPLSNGRLCPRGTAGMGNLYDPDRIRQPMLREGDSWRAASWEEALDFIAERMGAIKKRFGAESLALISHGHGASFLKHMMKAYGAPVGSAPSFAQCRGARETAFKLTYGEPVGSPESTDLENSSYLVMLGYHLGENMHNTQVQEFAKAIERGVELVVVDPRFSVAAGKAKHWLPIKPGTDLALLLAWIRLLIDEGRYNRDFVAAHCIGLEELRQAVAPYTPEWAYTQTGIDPALIRSIGRRMAMHGSSALVHPGRKTNWYGDDTQRVRAVAILNALLGNWGTKGGFFRGSKLKIPKYPTPPYPPSNYTFIKHVVERFPLADQVPTQELVDHVLEHKQPPITGWLIYGTDLFNNFPNKEKTINALKKLDLVVVIETHPIELTGWADVVLPDTTYLERYDDLHAPSWKKPFVALRQPVVAPQFDSRPAWWIARELALRLGLEEYFPWKTIEEYLEARLQPLGLTLADMKQRGVHVGEAPPPYTDTPRFKTPSGKIELYSETLAAKGFDPVPVYHPPAEPPPGFMRLLVGRVPVHSFGRTTNNRMLAEITPENEVWLNTISAREFGVRHGQRVRLVNQDGVKSDPIKVKVTQRIRPDCVYMAHGFGRKTDKLKQANGQGTADNDLLTRIVEDPIMGGTSTNTNFVTLLKGRNGEVRHG